MPLNAKLTLTHTIGGWDNALEIEERERQEKSRRRPQRNPDRRLRPGPNLRRQLAGSKRWLLDFGVANPV